ncbi:hypothetical protein A6M23_19735 [Acidithiobacillus thiooxidans]|uniref:Uncharacterized protein n=1 Tax=Acidithiobacillus thiooxidans TaxID=930 RepID=A0A1C2HW07_ACITH|nr:hypothetical protein A6M23_19735 [Acidithiobacillus thiooxidans]OCX80991.1 hypothetical protein A6P08_14935 [Acidithiobacillus thiooxidans]
MMEWHKRITAQLFLFIFIFDSVYDRIKAQEILRQQQWRKIDPIKTQCGHNWWTTVVAFGDFWTQP